MKMLSCVLSLLISKNGTCLYMALCIKVLISELSSLYSTDYFII